MIVITFLSGICVNMFTVVGGILGAFVAYNAVLALFRMCIREPSRNCVQLVASAMCQALDGRTTPERELIGLQGVLPWPLSRRLALAARSLQGTAPVTLVTTLAHNRLLPAVLVPLALSAERLGPAALAGWFRNLAGSLQPQRPRVRRSTPFLLTLLGMFCIGSFFMKTVEPKWSSILHQSMVPLHAFIILDALRPLLPWIEIGLAVPIAVGCAMWSRWRWLLERRIQCGEIISQALQLRFPEASIAAALGLHAGTMTLEELCRSFDWQARTPDEMLIAVNQAREIQVRRTLVACTILEILGPMILAVPVLLYGRLIFGTIIEMINELAKLS